MSAPKVFNQEDKFIREISGQEGAVRYFRADFFFSTFAVFRRWSQLLNFLRQYLSNDA